MIRVGSIINVRRIPGIYDLPCKVKVTKISELNSSKFKARIITCDNIKVSKTTDWNFDIEDIIPEELEIE